ncbi:MAG: hypothetical protein K2Q18_17885 [Bdellovibrionales bacterium]|nr:hypothetical protein [Bdellovibrionales bacterium]
MKIVGALLLTFLASSLVNVRAQEKAEEYRDAFKGAAPARDYTLEEKLAHYKMDDELRSGFYLIYDCDKKAFTCVDDVSFNYCKDRRNNLSYFEKEKKYACAPLKKYVDREACLHANYEVMQAAPFTRFCYVKNDQLN